MSEPSLPTEPLRAEHRDLLPHLQGLETIADEVDRWNADEAAHVLGEIVEFLRGHLIPHSQAEEQVLYPAVEQAMAAPGATATMRADHAEIVARIDRLADTAATVADRWPDNTMARDLTHQLTGCRPSCCCTSARRRCCCRCSTPPWDLTTLPRCSPRWARRRTPDRSAAMITKTTASRSSAGMVAGAG